jgi:hypothetical protein
MPFNQNSDFKDIVTNNYAYVDKTRYIDLKVAVIVYIGKDKFEMTEI